MMLYWFKFGEVHELCGKFCKQNHLPRQSKGRGHRRLSATSVRRDLTCWQLAKKLITQVQQSGNQ